MALLSAVLGCSYGRDRNVVTGWITPDYFVFQEVVALKKGEDAGGWRAACVRATMRDGDTGAKVVCEIEVGIPIKTQEHGWIGVNFARETAALTANQVAHTILSRRGAGSMLGIACEQFKDGFIEFFELRMKGSKVRRQCHGSLKPVDFDVTH